MSKTLRVLDWTPELIDRFWSRMAETRLAELSFGRLNGEKLLDLIEPHLSPTARHLDFGAGDGDLLRLLLNRGYPAAAFEVAAGRRERLRDADLARERNFLGVVGPDSGETFDVVLMLDVVEHVIDEQLIATFESVRRFLRPGGTIVVSTPNSEDLDLGMAYCPLSDTMFHRWQHVRSFSAETLEAFLGDRGFDRLRLHRVDFSSTADLQSRLQALEERTRLLDRRFRQGFLRCLLEYVRNRPLPERAGSPVRSPEEDLRIGAETHLVYVGKLRRPTAEQETNSWKTR